MIGAYASAISAGTLLTESGALALSGPGEPLGAFIAAYMRLRERSIKKGETNVKG